MRTRGVLVVCVVTAFPIVAAAGQGQVILSNNDTQDLFVKITDYNQSEQPVVARQRLNHGESEGINAEISVDGVYSLRWHAESIDGAHSKDGRCSNTPDMPCEISF